MRALTGMLALSLLIAPSLMRAQQSDQIPRELALALIPYGGSDGGEIIVGQIPPDLATTFTLPPGGRVLGSFVSLTYMQVVMTLPGSLDTAGAFARRSLEAHGWTARPMPTMRMGGLRYGTPESSRPSIYCKKGTPESISISTQFHGQSTLLRLTRNTGSSICDETGISGIATSSASFSVSGATATRIETAQSRMAEMPLASVPQLWSPSDFRTSQVCRHPDGMGTQSQDQQLRTDLSPQEILKHYGRQLDSAGWKSVDNASSVSGTWTNSQSGQEVTIRVTPVAAQTGCYDVSLSATARRSIR